MTTTIENIKVSYPDEMSIEEATYYLKSQLDYEKESGKVKSKLVALDIELDGSEVVLRPHYDTVIRTRRITGYLSTIPRFNDAKKAEEEARVKHEK